MTHTLDEQAQVSTDLLVVESVRRVFGSFCALEGVDLTLAPGEALGLVGPNGSGKTTLINVISGLLKPSSGQVLFEQAKISGHSPYRVARRGINRTFQIPKPFGPLTVRQNLQVAGRRQYSDGSADEILDLVGLSGTQKRMASTLTAANQKRLDLARALITDPRLLLVDELGAGLSVSELDELADVLRRLVTERGISMLVVEHLLGFLHKVTDRVVVLNAGKVIFSGTLADATQDETVVRVFIGG